MSTNSELERQTMILLEKLARLICLEKPAHDDKPSDRAATISATITAYRCHCHHRCHCHCH
eukprot:6245949-Heterocapsa_arctica.AAC.1